MRKTEKEKMFVEDVTEEEIDTKLYIPYYEEYTKILEITEADEYEPGDTDNYIGAKLIFPYGDLL